MAQSWSGDRGPAGWPRDATLEAAILELRLSQDDLRRARTWLIVSGVLGLIGGIAAIAVPAIASVTVAVFIGWVLVVSGLVMGVRAFALPPARERALRLLEAALALVAGVCILVFPLTGVLTLTFFLTAWFFASGALLLYAAWQVRGRAGAGWLAFNGGLSLLLALLIALELPSSAAWAIGLLVGVNLVFWGVRALIAARALKQAMAS